MREMLSILLTVAPGTTWLSVHVHREHNTVADDLSKLKLGNVVRFAESKGLIPEERLVPSWVVRALLDHLEHARAHRQPRTWLPSGRVSSMFVGRPVNKIYKDLHVIHQRCAPAAAYEIGRDISFMYASSLSVAM